MACLPELLHPLPAEALDGGSGLLEVGSRVKFIGMFKEVGADGSCHGKTVVSINVDLANAGLDSTLDLCDRNSPRLA